MRQRILARSTRRRKGTSGSSVESQYLVGSGLSFGHSISSVSSLRREAPLIGAVRTRTRANRDDSLAAEPSRQVIVRQACLGRLSASSLTLTRRFAGTPS